MRWIGVTAPRPRLRVVLLVSLVALIGAGVAVGTAVVLQRGESLTGRQVFDRRAESMRLAVVAEAGRYTDTLTTLAAAMSAHDDLTGDTFVATTAGMPGMALPGASGIAFVVAAEPAQVPAVQARWRSNGAGELRLRPVGTGRHLFTVFQRALNTPQMPPPGLDMSQSAAPAWAMRQAGVTGTVVSSPPYRLLADRALPLAEQQLSFALAAPVYAPGAGPARDRPRGWLLLGMRSQDFLGATMTAAAQGLVHSTLLAQVDGDWQQLAAHDPSRGATDLRRQAEVVVAGQRWQLHTAARRADLPGGETHLDEGVLIGGLTLTAMLSLLVFVLASARHRAERQVRAATADLSLAEAEARRQAGLLSAVMDSIGDGVGVVNDQGEFLLHNPAAKRILGVADDANGADRWQAHYGLFRPDGVTPFPTDELPLARAMAGEVCDNVELVVRNPGHPDGAWLNVSARPLDPSAGQPGAVAVFHDITDRKGDEGRVRSSEQRLRLLLDGERDHAIVMLDPAGRVASWSVNAERIKGYREDEILGEPYHLFFPPKTDAAEDPAGILATARAAGRVEVEGVRVRKDGTRYWAHGVMTALTDDTGHLHGFVEVTQDITARRKAEAKFRDLLEAAPDAILGCGPDGRIVLINSKVEQLFGYARDELLGQPVEILVPDAARAVHVGHRQRYLTDPVSRPMGTGMQLSAQRRDGTLFPAEVSLSTLDTEDGVIVSAAVRDITDRIETQRQLQQLNQRLRTLNEDLERRVHDRTAQLEAQTEALKQANSELEAFSYSVSHDLRAPLRAVDGFAQVLATDYGPALDEAGQRYLAKVRGGAQQMGALIDGLLAFSRMQRQAMTRQQVGMDGLVAEVWEELAPARRDRDVTLHVEDLPPALGDPRLVRHVLSNLLGNAVKYTKTCEHATIRVGAHRDEAGELVYFVADNGAGFDMRYADKLFKVFQRLHRAEEYEGTGIGLALTARIIRRHGGRIWADATPGAGATFSFTLPHTGPAADPSIQEHDHDEPDTSPSAARGRQPERLGAGTAGV